MATNGTVITSAYQGTNGTRYLEMVWERVGFDVVAQTTTISWTLTSRGTYSGYFTSAPFTIVVDNEKIYNSTTRIKLYPNQEIATGTHTIKHNTDGTKTINISVSGAIYSKNINVSGSGSFDLDLVGIATITEAPNFNDEQNPTIKYYNPVGAAISSLQAAISLTGENVDIAYRNISISGSSYTFTLTDAERKVLRAATQGSNSRKVRFYLRNVVEGEIYFNWKEVSFTVINANPTVAASVVDINTTTVALTGSNTTLIRYHSTAAATMTATAYKEATIKTNVIEHNGGLNTGVSLTVPNVNGNTFAFITSDSRGNTANETIVAPMIDYIKPTANIDTEQQMDTNGTYTLKVAGNYYNDTFGFTSAAAANTLTLKYRYKASGGNYGSWVSMSATKSGNTYAAETTLTGLNYRTAYIFQCQIVDKLNTVLSAEITVRSLPVFHWGENDFVFEVPVYFNAGFTNEAGAAVIDDTGGNDFSGDVSITGDLRLKGSGNYGNTIYFGDGSYCYLKEATDDDLTIKAGDILLDGRVYLNGATMESGSWQPTLSTSAAVSSYTTRNGWYQKLGKVITVGFNIKATINSGYNSTNIAISGLPFTPAYAAFGGGIAHNIYLSAGFCFEGFAAGTDGKITLRGQPCNNTAAGNLNITSSAYYPTGSNQTLTLAGTICYTIN